MPSPKRPASHRAHLAAFLRRLHLPTAPFDEVAHLQWSFIVPPGVFRAGLRETTDICLELLDAYPLPLGSAALEIGCGAGHASVVMASRTLDVTAADISELALEATAENAVRNGIRLRTRQSNYFSAFAAEERFALVFFNIPFLDSRGEPPEHSLDRAWFMAPGDLDRFFTEAANHLTMEGAVVVLTSTWADYHPDAVDAAAQRAGLVPAGRLSHENHWTLPGIAPWRQAHVAEVFVACRYRSC